MWLARLRPRLARGPEVCPLCGSDFVHPVEWQAVDESHMTVRLRCGECETWREAIFSDEVLERFDRRLDEATVLMLDQADRLHAEWRSTWTDGDFGD